MKEDDVEDEPDYFAIPESSVQTNQNTPFGDDGILGRWRALGALPRVCYWRWDRGGLRRILTCRAFNISQPLLIILSKVLTEQGQN